MRFDLSTWSGIDAELLHKDAGEEFDIRIGALAEFKTCIIDGSLKCDISTKIPSRLHSFSMAYKIKIFEYLIGQLKKF